VEMTEGPLETQPEEVEMASETEENDHQQREIVFEVDAQKPNPLADPEPEYKEEIHLVDKGIETISSSAQLRPSSPAVTPETGSGEENQGLNRMGNDRVQKLKALSEKLKNHTPIENNLYELESIPAYKRRNVDLNDVTPSSESQVPGMSISQDNENGLEIQRENSFLHKTVD